MGEESEDLEYVLLNKREVFIYQIPPASSSAGHKADDWKQCIWRGRCQVIGKGKDLSIKMIDAGNGSLFAQCNIPNGETSKFVERAVDSSRYFVLKISNGNRHAFVGLGFEDRNDAFDFNVCLQDFKTTFVDRDQQAESKAKIPALDKDFSLKEGQKITVKIGGLGAAPRRASGGDGGGGFAPLAPPPSASQSRREPSAAVAQAPMMAPAPAPARPAGPPAAAPAASNFADFESADFGDFESAFQSAPAPAAAPQGGFQPAPASSSPWPAGQPSAPMGGAPPAADKHFDAFNEQFGAFTVSPTPAPAPATPAPSSTDWSALDPLGPGGRAAPPQQQMGMDGGPPARTKNDPFDEFDIFK